MLRVPRALPYVPVIDAAPNPIRLYSVFSVTCALAWIAVSLRLWTRLRIIKKLGWDDKMMAFALILFTVYCGAVASISRLVSSKVSFDNLMVSVNLLHVAEVFYILTLLLLKLSLGILFLRVFVDKRQRDIIKGTVAVSTLYSVVMFFFVTCQCGYYHGALGFLIKELTGKCAPRPFVLGMVYTQAGVTTLTDWTFLLLPIFLLRDSIMKKDEKLTVGFILGFASVSGIASIVRFTYIKALIFQDATFFVDARNIAIWSALEQGVGIIAGSLFTLRPLVRHYAAAYRTESPGIAKGRRARRPYEEDLSLSTTKINEPQVPPRMFLGSKTSKTGTPWVDEEMVQSDLDRWKATLKTEKLVHDVPLKPLPRASVATSSTSKSRDRQEEIARGVGDWQNGEHTFGEDLRPFVPPKTQADTWRPPTPLKKSPQPSEGVSPKKQPGTSVGFPWNEESHGRRLALNSFHDADTPEVDSPRTTQPKYALNENIEGEAATREALVQNLASKRRRSGLPLNMFDSGHVPSSCDSNSSISSL